jgi:uncharacterized protein YuzE
MKLTYDQIADAMYIELTNNLTISTKKVNDSFLLHLDEDDAVVGIEVLNVRKLGINPLEVMTSYYTTEHQAEPPDPAEIEQCRAAIMEARKRKRLKETENTQ